MSAELLTLCAFNFSSKFVSPDLTGSSPMEGEEEDWNSSSIKGFSFGDDDEVVTFFPLFPYHFSKITTILIFRAPSRS